MGLTYGMHSEESQPVVAASAATAVRDEPVSLQETEASPTVRTLEKGGSSTTTSRFHRRLALAVPIVGALWYGLAEYAVLVELTEYDAAEAIIPLSFVLPAMIAVLLGTLSGSVRRGAAAGVLLMAAVLMALMGNAAARGWQMVLQPHDLFVIGGMYAGGATAGALGALVRHALVDRRTSAPRQ